MLFPPTKKLIFSGFLFFPFRFLSLYLKSVLSHNSVICFFLIFFYKTQKS